MLLRKLDFSDSFHRNDVSVLVGNIQERIVMKVSGWDGSDWNGVDLNGVDWNGYDMNPQQYETG